MKILLVHATALATCGWLLIASTAFSVQKKMAGAALWYVERSHSLFNLCFYLYDCLKQECTGENELLFTSFSGKFWECRAPGPALKSLACPVGGYNICPSEDTATTPDPDTITENPLGECRCEGELWVSEGCSYAYTCNSSSAPKDNLFLCDEVPKGYLMNME